jgi:hypothetical protein
MKKRQTIKEIRTYERMRGFEECLLLFEDAWRENGFENGIDSPMKLWPTINESQKVLSKLDTEWKTIMWPRVYGKEWK